MLSARGPSFRAEVVGTFMYDKLLASIRTEVKIDQNISFFKLLKKKKAHYVLFTNLEPPCISLVQHNKQCRMKVLLNSFYLNGHALRFFQPGAVSLFKTNEQLLILI